MKTLFSIFIALFIGYVVSVILSFLFVAIGILGIVINERRRERFYCNYGIKDFMTHSENDNPYLLLLLPVVNLVISISALFIVFTDWGDY